MRRTPLKRKTGFKRNPATARKAAVKKRLSATALWASYGLKKPSYVRYSGHRGIFWHLFSIKVRRRDFEAFGGECIDQCGKRAADWHDFDAGHFIAASRGGFGLLFDERNVNGQLKACNNPTFSPDAGKGYWVGLDRRYGPGTAQGLWDRRNDRDGKEWSQIEYEARIRALIEELAQGPQTLGKSLR